MDIQHNKLRELRKSKNVPVKKLANALGLKTAGAYYKKEYGMSKITIEEAKIIAEVLEASLDEIFYKAEVS